jgi:hypothetical protein
LESRSRLEALRESNSPGSGGPGRTALPTLCASTYILLDRRPDSMDIVMIFERLKEFTYFDALRIGKLRKLLGQITSFARYNDPTFFPQSLRDSVSGRSIGDESRAGHTFRYTVILQIGKRFHFIGACLDRCRFRVNVLSGTIGLDQSNMIEQKFIAAGRSKLARFEERANFWRRAILIIGEYFDDYRNFVGRVTFEDDGVQNEFVVTNSGPFLNRALDYVTSNTRLSRLFHDGRESGISAGVRTAQFGGNHDFFHELTYGLTLLQVSNFPFCLKPLASHTIETLNHE